MTINTVFDRVMVLLFIMIIGYIARKAKVINEKSNKVFTDLLIYVTIPVLILSSYQIELTFDRVKMAWQTFLFGLLVYFIMIVFAFIVSRKCKPEQRAIFQFSLIFSNCAFMGFPVIGSFLGKEGIFLTSIFIIHFNVLLWTYGLMLFTGKKSFKSLIAVLKNPSIIAIFLGMLTFIFQIKFPSQVAEALETTGGITITLSMIMIGSTIAGTPLKEVFKGTDTYIVSFLRLLVMPCIILFAALLLKLPSTVTAVCTILSGMPVAANTVLFAEKFDKNILTASKNVAFSTIFSIATIPIIAAIIQYFTGM
jgi:predicted permease